MRRARPVVGVPAALTRLPTTTSVGRIWPQALARLRGDFVIRAVEDPGRPGRLRRRVDAWLVDGHQGPIDTTAPVVALLLEAAWSDPDLRPLMEPWFLERYEGPSAAAATQAARVITISESSRQQILHAYGLDGDRVVVAPVGIDHEVYRPGLAPPDDLLRRAGSTSDLPYVLFVSTVHPRKNLDALRGALELLAAAGHPHRLVLVGGPAADRSDSTALKQAAVAPLAGVPDRVVNLAGASDEDVARLMGGAAAFCLPSLMEGFGMAVAEAMACGAPVVVSDRGSLPEVAGAAGIVTAPDAASVADGLRRVLTDPAERAARRDASLREAARFTWDAMAAVWSVALAEALDIGPSAPSRPEVTPRTLASPPDDR